MSSTPVSVHISGPEGAGKSDIAAVISAALRDNFPHSRVELLGHQDAVHGSVPIRRGVAMPPRDRLAERRLKISVSEGAPA